VTQVIREILVPAREGRATEVAAGQVLRVVDVDGQQVGDMVVLNRHDFRERYCAWLSWILCGGTFLKVTTLYSNPPFTRPLLSIEEDKVGVHYPGPGRCSRAKYEKHGMRDRFGCQEILERTLYPYGIEPHNIPDVFNVFMRVNPHEDGRYEIGPPAGNKGDYTDFRAHLDCLIAISACPDDVWATNNHKCKPLLMQVLEK